MMRLATLTVALAFSLPAFAQAEEAGSAGRRAEAEGRSTQTDDLKIGDAAPSFTLPLYNPSAGGATTASLDSYIGPDADDKGAKAIVLSFFATYCAPCKREMPYLEQLQEMYRDAGLRVLMISIDRDEAAGAKIAELVKQNKITFPILKDRFNFLARRYLGAQAPLPSLFIVGQDGNIRTLNRGYGKDASTFLLAQVQQALGLAKKKTP